MTREEIRQKFDGKWVYIVKTNYDAHSLLLSGVPIVVADKPYDGLHDGVYEKYKQKEYGGKVAYSLLDEPAIVSIFS